MGELAGMITFKLQVENANKVEFAFGKLATAVSDWRKYIWPGVRSGALRPWLRKQFASEGAKGAHGSWKELKGPYRTRKGKVYPGKPILEASGRMKRDLLSEANEGETTPRMMYYGTNLPYAKFHQTGTRKMAARRIFDPEEIDGPGTMKRMVRTSVARGVANYARRLGFALGATSIREAGAIGHRAMMGGTSVAEGL